MRSERFPRRLIAVLSGILLIGAPPAPANAAAPLAADDGARVIARHRIGPSEFDITVSSPALGTTAPVRVIVPSGWTPAATRTWPVVYAYHGGRDTYVSWTRSTDIERIAAAYDVMVVMPDTGYAGWFTDWHNYGRGGAPKWETFHTSELLQLMERDYHAGTRRAVMGISSSGYGAVKYAARHPGMFRYAVSLSGILHLTAPLIRQLVLLEASEKYDPYRIWGIPYVDERNWRANDPYLQAEGLRGTGLYIASGLTGRPGPSDPPGSTGTELQEVFCGQTTVAFLHRLAQLHIPATAHVYQDGYHDWSTWQPELHTAWPLMMRAIGAGSSAA